MDWEYDEFWRKKEFRAEKPNGLGAWWEVGGKSTGYWQEIRRTEAKAEVERQQTTRFGQSWANGTGSRTGDKGQGLWFPWHSPAPRVDAAYWRQGILGTIEPRIASAASKQWPAKQPVETPPYVLKLYQAIASAVIIDRLGLSNDPYSLQRLRDLRAHILERRRHTGSLFQDVPIDLPGTENRAKFARGIRWAELEYIELYRRSDRLRWFIEAKVDDGCDGQVHTTPACERNDAAPLDQGIHHGADSAIAAIAGFDFQEIEATMAERLHEKQRGGAKFEFRLLPKDYRRHTPRHIRDPDVENANDWWRNSWPEAAKPRSVQHRKMLKTSHCRCFALFCANAAR